MHTHKYQHRDLNNVNIYILSEVRTSILFISILTLLEQHQDVLGSGLVMQVFCGVSGEKHAISAL